MPLAFGDAENSGAAHVNRTATVVVASVLIGLAYSSSLVLFLFHFDERMLLIQSLLVYVCLSGDQL
jgi:RsiW-degrading membrane proteinase PrsW (M82 family)